MWSLFLYVSKTLHRFQGVLPTWSKHISRSAKSWGWWASAVMWPKRDLLIVRNLAVKCPGRKESFEMNQISKTVMKKYCINLNIKPRCVHWNSCDIHEMFPNRFQWCLQSVWCLECGTSLSRSSVNFAPWRQAALDSPGRGCRTEAATWGCAHPYGEPTCKHVGWELWICFLLSSQENR